MLTFFYNKNVFKVNTVKSGKNKNANYVFCIYVTYIVQKATETASSQFKVIKGQSVW